MSNQASKALVGGFVLGAVILITVGIIIFGSGHFFSEKQAFVLYFDGAVNGLTVGAPVKFRGVTIGAVTSIILRFDPGKLDFLIPVEIEILPKAINTLDDRDYSAENVAELLITQGLRAQLRPANYITGQLLVQLDFHPNTPELKRGDGSIPEIPTIPSQLEELSRALDQIPFKDLVERLMGIFNEIDALIKSPHLKEGLDQFDRTLKDIQALAIKMNRELDRIGSGFDTLSKQTQATLKQAEVTLRMEEGTPAEVASELKVMLQAASVALQEMEETLQTVKKMADQNSPLQFQLQNSLEEFTLTARSIRNLAEYLERHPEALLRGKQGGKGP